jgi:ribosome silencing factor RsfS/YbeB/iojap
MAAKRPSRSSSASSARPAARAARKAPAKTVAKGPAKARAKLPRKVAAGTRPATTKLATAKATATAKAKARAKAPPALAQVVLAALEDMKAVNVKAMDVRGITDITDMMVVASGTSDRHVKSIADRVVQRCKEAGYRPYGIEGERDGEWVLLDLNDVVLHVMLPRVREFYALEKLWEKGAARGS